MTRHAYDQATREPLRVFYGGQGQQEYRSFDAVGRDLHIDTAMSNLVLNYRPEGFIADKIFPIVPVGKQSDVYFIFNQGDLYRVPSTLRAPATAPRKVAFNVSSATYYARNYALSYVIPVEDAQNADDVLNLRQRGAFFLSDLLALDMEVRVANLVTSATNVGSGATPSSVWSDLTVSNPILDIDTAIENVRRSVGYKPNRAIFSERAWRLFKRNANVLKIMFPAFGGQLAGPGVPTLQMVQNAFDLDFVGVSGIVQNAAAEGLAMSLSDIWASHVLVYYAPPRPSKEVPSLGYCFRWRVPEVPDMTVERIPYDPRVKAEEEHVGYYQDEKITATGYGFLISSVSAT